MLTASRSPAEVAVELPFTIVFEPPSQDELQDALRMRAVWLAGILLALAIGTVVVVAHGERADATVDSPLATLEVTSRPSGASVWLDGRELGRTPVQLHAPVGAHSVLLQSSDALPAQYAVDLTETGAAVNALLLRRQPSVTRVRSTLPGANLADVRLLASGELALSLAIPTTQRLQAWRLNPADGALHA